ncbi:LysR family transcriptional regulator [Pasteurellaceae bacterium Macca]|nr:LysR family transcriptional regulator [Pasteurellaceae bacterium Macca]
MDRLTAMKVFLNVAQRGSFSATAEHLGLSRPMVTRYIALLEEWLNARLFHRTTRYVTLTHAGEQAVHFCEKMVHLAQEMEQETASENELKGTIRLTSSTSFGSSHLVSALNRFQQKHPKLALQLYLREETLNLVEERIDLAIRLSASPDENLLARPLAPCHSALVASPSYLAKFGLPEQPWELTQHRCLAHSHLNAQKWRLSRGEEVIGLELPAVFSSNSAEALFNMALEGGGIGMLPRYLVNSALEKGLLVQVLSEWQPPQLTVYALYTSRQKQPHSVRRLLDFLVEEFAHQPW